MAKFSQAIRPSSFVEIRKIAQGKEETDIDIEESQEKLLDALSKHEGWAVFKQYVEELKEELELDISNFSLFESSVFFSPHSNQYRRRNFYLAQIPDLKSLNCHEGEMVIMRIEQASKLKMLEGQSDLLKKAYSYLVSEKLIITN